MSTFTIPGDVDIQGNLLVRGTIPSIARSGLTQESIQPFTIPLDSWRVHDAFQTLLGSAASDDLGCTCGVFGTGTPYLTAGDLKAAGATTRYGRAMFQIPVSYVAGETLQIAAKAGMLTTVADTSCTIDFQAYKCGEDTLVSGGDLVTTSATTINSLTFAEKAFVVTPSTLSPGDWLDIRVAIACNDAATGTAVIGAIAGIELQADIRG